MKQKVRELSPLLRKQTFSSWVLVALVVAAVGAGYYIVTGSRADANCTTTLSSGGDIATAIGKASAGDTICLGAGSYNAVSLSGVSKSSSVTIEPVAGAVAAVDSLNIDSSSGLSFENIKGSGGSGGIGGVTLTGNSRNITIANSTFTAGSYINLTSAVNSTTGKPDVVIDSDTFDNINQPADGYEGRVQFEGTGSDVQISNSHFSGGCADGIQTGANGGDIGPGNEFTGILQSCTAHHVDPLQIYGGQNLDIHDNYFHGNSTGIMMPDVGDDNITITNNVFDSPNYPPLTLGGTQGDVITHNTTNGTFRIYEGNEGQDSKNNTVTNNIIGGFTLNADGSSPFKTEDYNIGSDGTGPHDLKGNPTFVGGSSPGTLAGWQLAASSIGIKAASDGTNIGAPAATTTGSGGTTTTPPPAADTTPPTVSLAAPTNNASVSGTVTVSATATDNVKVSSVQFELDGNNLGSPVTTPSSGSTYSYSWNTSGVTSGAHTLKALATDSSNNSATSTAVTVQVAAAKAGPSTSTPPPSTKSSSCFASPGSCGYPDPAVHNVGVADCTTLTKSGSVTANTAGQTIQNMNITGTITVNANNVTITNDCVTDNGNGTTNTSAITVNDGITGTVISNTTVAGANATNQSVEAAIAYDHNGNGGTVTNDYFYNCGECIHGPWTVNNSYVIANGVPYAGGYKATSQGEVGQGEEDHFEDWYFNNGTVSANQDTMLNPEGNTAVLFGDTNSHSGGPAVNHVTFTNSLVAGSGYLFYPYGNATSVGTGTMNISNNRFARCVLPTGTSPVFDSGSGGYTCPGIAVTQNDGNGYYPYSGYYGVADYYSTGTNQIWSGNFYDDNHATVNITDGGAPPTCTCLNILAPPKGSTTPPPPPPTPSPTTPTNLHSTAVTATSVSLAWTASQDTGGPGLAGYNVYRDGNLIGTTNSATTNYNDTTGLTAGTGYSYTVEAYDTSSTGNPSLPTAALVVKTATPTQPLAPPTQLTATAPNDTTVNLSWTASTGQNIIHYYVVRASTGSPATTIASLGNATSYSDTPVAANTAYTYYIMAGDSSGATSAASNSMTITTPKAPVVTPPVAVPAPSNLKAVAVSSSQVNLSWTASASTSDAVVGYYVYRSDKGSTPYATVTTGTTWGENDLTPGTTYTYAVAAVDAPGHVSAQTSPVSVETPATTSTGGSGTGSAFLGTKTVGPQVDNNPVGTAEVFQATATTAGAISKVHVYIDKSSRAGTVVVGLYQDNNGKPGALLAQGAATQLATTAWDTIAVPQVSVTAGQKYWIAILGTSSGRSHRATVGFRDSNNGTTDTISASTTLSAMPAQWAPGATYTNSPLSAYATN